MLKVWYSKKLVAMFACLALSFCLFFILLTDAVHGATITDIKPGVPVALKIPDTDLLVKGCVGRSSLVTVFNDGAISGAVSSNQNGEYSKLLSSQTPTIHHIQTYFEDSIGNRTVKTSNNVALPPKTLTTVTVNPAPTVSVIASAVTSGSDLVFKGYTCPNSTVTLTIDGASTYSSTSDSTGRWQITLNSIGLRVGTHIYTVSAAKSGYASVASQTRQFQVVASQESSVATVGPAEIPAPTTQTPGDGETIEGDRTIISGESLPNAQINIYENGVLFGTISADASGNWSFEYIATSSPVTLSFEACLNGRCSVLSASITLYFDGLGKCTTDFRLLNYRFWNKEVNEQINLDISYSTGSGVVVVDWGDGVTEKLNHDHLYPVTIYNDYKKPGQYNGVIKFMQSDCEKVRYFSVNVLDNTRQLSFSNLAFIGLLPVILYLLRRRHLRSSDQ